MMYTQQVQVLENFVQTNTQCLRTNGAYLHENQSTRMTKLERYSQCRRKQMSHSVEEFYKKCSVLHEKAIELHRERYKVSGSYDKPKCTFLLDDIKALARQLIHGPVDLEIDFGKE